MMKLFKKPLPAFGMVVSKVDKVIIIKSSDDFKSPDD